MEAGGAARMTEQREEGGPAFPHGGLTMRDWFAGQALASLAGTVCNDGSDFLHPLGVKSAAQWAYSFADAMIEARNK